MSGNIQLDRAIINKAKHEFRRGETRTFEHCRKDSHKMHVTLSLDGKLVLAHCKHCGKGTSIGLSHKYGKPPLTVLKKVALPPDLELISSQSPVYVTEFLRKGGLSLVQAREHGFRYSPLRDTLTIAVHGAEDVLMGYIERTFDKDLPKYLTHVANRKLFYKYCDNRTSRTLVVTEDIISAIRVSKYASSLACCGVALPAGSLSVVSLYNKFIIWLDNDNRQVIMARMKLASVLSQFGTVRIIKDQTDPKHYTDIEIRKVLEDASSK